MILYMLLPKKKYTRIMIIGRLALFLILCLLLFAGCGGQTAPDQPLTTGSDTATTTGSSINTRVQIASITVKQGQTNLNAYPGGYMTLAISTSPFALCALQVNYGLKSPSKSQEMAPVTTDTNGIASWHWAVSLNAHTGTWPLTISAILPNGSRTTCQVNVYVSLAPISVTSSTLSASPGQQKSLTIATAPFVNCSIQFVFEAGKPTRTISQKANGSGTVSWTWIVGKAASVGTHQIKIIATLAD